TGAATAPSAWSITRSSSGGTTSRRSCPVATMPSFTWTRPRPSTHCRCAASWRKKSPRRSPLVSEGDPMPVPESRSPRLGVTLAGLLIGSLFARWLPAVESPDGDPAPTCVAIPVSIQVRTMRKDDPDTAADLQAIRAAGRAIQPLHVPKAKPRPGDWLAAHHEPGQTFDQYRATDPNRPTARRTTLYLQPLGDF